MAPAKRKSTAPTRYEATPPPKKAQKVTKLRTRSSRGGGGDTEMPDAAPVPEPSPAKADETKPLPALETVDVAQHVKLKSVAESGLLETTLHRSKAKWLAEGIFQKYWTKPSKRKDFIPDPKNPGKETMTKLGTCRIVVEPHIFEATLFTIKEPGVATPAPLPAPPVRAPGTGYSAAPQVPQSFSQPSPGPSRSTPLAPPANVAGQPTSQSPQTPRPQNTVANAPSAVVPPSGQQSRPAAAPASAPQSQSKPPQDPVIQMLATRASQDPKLKELMKIVASGTANADQLAEFQRHIDELTAILAKQREEQRKADIAAATSSMSTPTGTPGPAFPAGMGLARPSPVTSQPMYTHQPPPKPKVYQAIPNVTGICIEFAAGSGDRYLLPRHTLLDYLKPGIVLASFLVVRKGSLGEEGRLDPKKEYYQPVTLRIESSQLKVLQTLARGVVTYPEALKYLQETMNKYPRAEEIRPSLQVPDDADDVDGAATPSAALDRRQSLLRVATTAAAASPAPVEKMPAKSKKAFHDQFANNCRFCMAPQPSSQPRDMEGRAICASCRQLRDASIRGTGVVRLSGLPIRPPAGPATLMMA